MRIGYALISEEHPPGRLVEHAKRAEQAGFQYLSLSDHFHPWLPSQGESPFAWTVLGGLLEATTLPVVMQVTCPIKRYHPAIVAQAAATAASMGQRPFVLGLGTGEALNENVVGGPWPAPSRRLEMLEEAIEVIRALWTGEPVTHYGQHVTVDRATLYTLPEHLPEIAIAVSGERSIGLAAQHGHLLSTAPSERTVRAYRDAGGSGEVFGQASMCFADDRGTAQRIMLERWRHGPLGWDVNAELTTPGAFVTATTELPDAAILGPQPFGSDEGEYRRSLELYERAGFDAVSLHNVGAEQTRFIETIGGWLFR
ncbi:MAG: TIGR03557 family F420-dependent LLM class oxidoreductase [Nitriliruptoraceae bacterium]